MIPEMARCNAAGSQERIRYLMKRSLKLVLLYGTVCAGVEFLLADQLCILLYKNDQAGFYLKLFAPMIVMLYADIITDAMIKGLGQQNASVRYNILTSSMDVALLFGEEGIMKDTVWMTLPLTVYILFKCVQGLKKKIDEEKNG